MNPKGASTLIPQCVAGVLLALLGACSNPHESATPVATGATPLNNPTSPTIATINGKPITRDVFDFYVESISGDKDTSRLTSAQRSEALDELVGTRLMADQAVKAGLEDDPAIAARLAVERMQLLAAAESQKYLQDKQPTEQELRAEYDKRVAAIGKTEYHARHILVSSKDQAIALIKRLKAGANFAALAKKYSIDSARAQGGDLGWFEASQMLKPFADALKSLKKGAITPQPVHTLYGWHIIQLLDTRPSSPPPFDQLKSQVTQMVMRQKLQEYVQQLKKKATVQSNFR